MMETEVPGCTVSGAEPSESVALHGGAGPEEYS
jgi:hypothetical protein